MVQKGDINQFSTDLDDPPEFRKAADDSKIPEEFKETIRTEFPELKPLVVKDKTFDEVFYKASEAAHNMARFDITHQEDKEGRIEGVYTTLVLRYKEDFTILVKQGASADEVVVNMRTRSRSSGGLDGNERITGFMDELKHLLGIE